MVFTGDLDAAKANLDAEAAIAETLRQPVQLWQTYTVPSPDEPGGEPSRRLVRQDRQSRVHLHCIS